jgi:hypothetical protein
MAIQRKKMFKGFGALCAVSLILAGCGIVGGSNNNGNDGGGTSLTGQAQGVYSGITSSGYSFETIVLPNDRFYEIYGTLIGNLYSVTGMVSGQGISGDGTYSASANELLYTGQTIADTLTASVVQDSSLGGTLIPIGSLSGVSFTGTALPSSSFNYSTPASLADLYGSWTGTELDGTSTTITFNSDGTVSGSASGCPISGTVVADPSNKNFFEVSLKFGAAPCPLLNQTASGVAVDSLLADGVTHQLWIVVTEGASAGTAFLAQRSAGSGGATPNALNGRYAFSLGGFDSAGNPMSIAGSIQADGFGHITTGVADVNDNGMVSSNSPLAGTYAFDSNIVPAGTFTFESNAQSALGTIALTYTVGTVSHPLAFGFSLQSSGGFGEIMSLDTNDFIASGTVEQQSSSVLTASSLAGDYVVALNGTSGGNPAAALGRLTLASGGSSSNVAFDRSMAGLGTAGPTTGGSATVAFGSAGPDTNGRGTFTLTLSDALANTSQRFAYYAISANRMLAVEMDGNGTMRGEFSGQRTPFTAATVVSSGSVFAMAGVDTSASSNEITAVGQLQMSGVGANAGTVRWDSNDAGIIVGPASFASQAVPVFDAGTGRGTVSVAGGAANGLADSLVFYLSAAGTGYVMDGTLGINNRAMAGTLMAQAVGPYTTVTDLGGLGMVRTVGSAMNGALSLVGLFGPTTSPGAYALSCDQRYTKNGAVQTQTDQSLTNIAVQWVDELTGRGTLTIPSSGKTATKAFYVVGPNEFVFIDISPASSGLNGPSNLSYVNPH